MGATYCGVIFADGSRRRVDFETAKEIRQACGRTVVGVFADQGMEEVSAIARALDLKAVQLHGGIGMTDEHDVGLFIKRARVAERTFGSAGYHHDRYASLNGY